MSLRLQGEPGRNSGRWRLAFLVGLMAVLALITLVAPAAADGAMQISGLGRWPAEGECIDFPPGFSDYSFVLEEGGDLVGCVYVHVDFFTCSPSGTVREIGKEYYVVDGPYGPGTFMTNYRFTGKFEDCSDVSVGEIFGRCQHPVIAGSGTEGFVGVTGRLDFKDDVDAGNFPMRGHLRR